MVSALLSDVFFIKNKLWVFCFALQGLRWALDLKSAFVILPFLCALIGSYGLLTGNFHKYGFKDIIFSNG